MPVIFLWLIAGGAVAAGAGYLIDKTGEAAHDVGAGVNETSTAALKLALAALAGYVVLKKTKVL